MIDILEQGLLDPIPDLSDDEKTYLFDSRIYSLRRTRSLIKELHDDRFSHLYLSGELTLGAIHEIIERAITTHAKAPADPKPTRINISVLSVLHQESDKDILDNRERIERFFKRFGKARYGVEIDFTTTTASVRDHQMRNDDGRLRSPQDIFSWIKEFRRVKEEVVVAPIAAAPAPNEDEKRQADKEEKVSSAKTFEVGIMHCKAGRGRSAALLTIDFVVNDGLFPIEASKQIVKIAPQAHGIEDGGFRPDQAYCIYDCFFTAGTEALKDGNSYPKLEAHFNKIAEKQIQDVKPLIEDLKHFLAIDLTARLNDAQNARLANWRHQLNASFQNFREIFGQRYKTDLLSLLLFDACAGEVGRGKKYTEKQKLALLELVLGACNAAKDKVLKAEDKELQLVLSPLFTLRAADAVMAVFAISFIERSFWAKFFRIYQRQTLLSNQQIVDLLVYHGMPRLDSLFSECWIKIFVTLKNTDVIEIVQLLAKTQKQPVAAAAIIDDCVAFISRMHKLTGCALCAMQYATKIAAALPFNQKVKFVIALQKTNVYCACDLAKSIVEEAELQVNIFKRFWIWVIGEPTPTILTKHQIFALYECFSKHGVDDEGKISSYLYNQYSETIFWMEWKQHNSEPSIIRIEPKEVGADEGKVCASNFGSNSSLQNSADSENGLNVQHVGILKS